MSGPARLYDAGASVTALTLREFKQRGAQLMISYAYNAMPFGWVRVLGTACGVCGLEFVYTDLVGAVPELYEWPNTALWSDPATGASLTAELSAAQLRTPATVGH